MRGSPRVIELLNEVLTAELTAVNQYFIHAKMCENWGYERLGKHNRDESIGEMKDADELIERILYLEGVPNLQRLGTVMVGETVPEQLSLDLQNETRRDRPPQPRHRRCASKRATTAAAICSRTSSKAKKSTPTGWSHSSTSSPSSAKPTTSPNKYMTSSESARSSPRTTSATEPGRTLRVRGGAAANPTRRSRPH